MWGDSSALNAGDVAIRSGGSNRLLWDESSGWFTFLSNDIISVGTIRSNSSLFLLEQSAALGDQTGNGQFWVKDDTPNTPMFTDDAGTDYNLLDGLTWSFQNGAGPFSAVAGNGYVIDLAGSAKTINLPATIAAGQKITIHCIDTTGSATLTVGRNTNNIRYKGTINGEAGGGADDVTMTDGQTMKLVASSASNWEIV